MDCKSRTAKILAAAAAAIPESNSPSTPMSLKNSWRQFCNVGYLPPSDNTNTSVSADNEADLVDTNNLAEKDNAAHTAAYNNENQLSDFSDFSDLDPDYVPSSFEGISDEEHENEISDIEGKENENPKLDTQEKRTSRHSSPLLLQNVHSHEEPKSGCSREIRHNIESENIRSSPCPQYSQRKNKKKPPARYYCYYCETLVLNFSRHIRRCHSMEIEVQRILSKPVKSQDRKKLFTSLRKKGNYLRSSENCMKPMKNSVTGNMDQIPCPYCLGFYARKQLWRHKKKCDENPSLEKNISSTSNLFFKHNKTDPDLREKVFPKMRPDKISVIAQQDSLICAFGARYSKVHREQHFINVTSRKMRELARLLIAAKKFDGSIISMIDLLQPKYYDLIVTATKRVAQYDTDRERFKSPTFAMNIATSLKQCCDIAVIFALKRKDIYSTVAAAEAESAIKTLSHLLESNWKYDISTEAANNLNMNRWNKITIVPLAKDLKLLNEYLAARAEDAKKKLQLNSCDRLAYKELLETIYCRVIVLNRKRPGESQRLLIDRYDQSKEDDRHNYEEFSDVISPTEKILMKRFKRIVIRGKRNRGVPVMFSTDVQQDIDIMITSRTNFVNSSNKYLFAPPGSNSHIVGYKVLAKYAKACGAERYDALTSTRLRKHLATLSQIFNMTESDLEQLSTFMGHTPGTHKNSYRLPDDVYQSSKILKILLLMEKGTAAAAFKGKSLDEIDVDLDENLEDDLEPDDDVTFADYAGTEEMEMNYIVRDMGDNVQHGNLAEKLPTENEKIEENNIEEKNKKKKIQRIPWTDEQKRVVKNFFKANIEKKIPPKRAQCEQPKEENFELLKNKDWQKIKVFIQNTYTKS